MHIHVQSSDGETKLWIEPQIEFAKSYGLSEQDLTRIKDSSRREHRRSGMPGKNTLHAGVTNISPHGFWMLVDDRELVLPFDEFPWFKTANVQAILNVVRPHSDHLHRPDIDVDLTIDSIEHPEKYPLKARQR